MISLILSVHVTRYKGETTHRGYTREIIQSPLSIMLAGNANHIL